MSSSCAFCRIARGEEKAYVVYEDEHVIAFLDINPISEGHILVAPKRHYERLSCMPSDELEALARGLQRVLVMVERGLSRDYNVVVNTGRGAGQVVMHVHVHVVPRYPGDGLRVTMTQRHRLTEEEAVRVLTKLNEAKAGTGS